MKAFIFANGTISDYEYIRSQINKTSYIICADGGLRHCIIAGLEPDLLIGDFDSVSAFEYASAKDANIEILTFPTNKDYTDTELAVKTALDRGYKNISIFGALGSRFDHSVGNLFLLKMIAQSGGVGRILDSITEIFVINKEIIIKNQEYTSISLLPLDEKVNGVTTDGLMYPLSNATLSNNKCNSISNEFSKDQATIRVSKGYLAVVLSRESK